MRVGIFFGGTSKEREISFAGGRTVYDNLNKSLFEPIPIFVDSFGNFILLKWEFIYKGSIRDFYPPAEFLDASGQFQIYAENLGELSFDEQIKLIKGIGRPLTHQELNTTIDFAFLCLHGPDGEDGRIQGLLDYLKIPYSGSGILPSAIGIDKVIQKRLMKNAGFNVPRYFTVKRNEWTADGHHSEIFSRIENEIGYPAVIKASRQGSSIGISILQNNDPSKTISAIEKSFFISRIKKNEWEILSPAQKIESIKSLSDIREGIGMPLKASISGGSSIIYHPQVLLELLDKELENKNEIILESLDGENEIMIESFLEGREFSCIVLENENGNPIALPPTEIKKGKELFDYRSKYLPGLSRKITPIDIEDSKINEIREECERLYCELGFDVYARIDGFVTLDGKVFLNDPNTTSGMMPSSFFFHQAAEIGLNPSQFLTFLIRTSIQKRSCSFPGIPLFNNLLQNLDSAILEEQESKSEKIKIAVILGGFSSERHISVESGRNIYEKLASSSKYQPFPVFLTGSSNEHELYLIPINILLKDNADDIREKINEFKVHKVINTIIQEASGITHKYSDSKSLSKPKRIAYKELGSLCDGVFIALHGRPGEDGAVQRYLEELHIPYNGSGIESSGITINKFKTNEVLSKNGCSIANHLMIEKNEWLNNQPEMLQRIKEICGLPFIAKPVDDGCSSAVKKIKTAEEFLAFAELMFRDKDELPELPSKKLNIKPKEEFPRKNAILVEELISRKSAKHFLEITGGMLTSYNDKREILYEIFEPSETLAEGEVLSLEEKFLAGQGQNITPSRFDRDPENQKLISLTVRSEFEKAARILNIQGYSRIDAFVRIFDNNKVEVIFIEVNSLPGMTPATCIFHQCAINGYKPYEFIDKILEFGFQREKQLTTA